MKSIMLIAILSVCAIAARHEPEILNIHNDQEHATLTVIVRTWFQRPNDSAYVPVNKAVRIPNAYIVSKGISGGIATVTTPQLLSISLDRISEMSDSLKVVAERRRALDSLTRSR